jgi:hypothetical protein
MFITTLFPEFVFSKAICELQMAVDHLQAVKENENLINWRVDFGCGLQFLHKLLHLFGSLPSSGTIDGTGS